MGGDIRARSARFVCATGRRQGRRRQRTLSATKVLMSCAIHLILAVSGILQEAQAESRDAFVPRDDVYWHHLHNETKDSSNGDTGGDRLDSSQVARRLPTTAEIRTDDRENGDNRRLAAAPGSWDRVGDCILLFGAFCNGNLGDVIQPLAMKRLLASIAPDQCFWYAHPGVETASRGYRVGQFFGTHESRLLPIQAGDADQVNRFKALIIGGGGIFGAIHYPLHLNEFSEGLKLPIIVLGVGASYRAKKYGALLERATFISGRDITSIKCLSSVLMLSKDPVVQSNDVAFVRDTVLSDKSLSDTEGTCWKQSEDDQPLCFILPASNTDIYDGMHRQLVAEVVRPGDVFVNVFPKHQQEIEAHGYPGSVEEILDPALFAREMCACKAIISGRLHGAILGLHMGVPTFGFHRDASGEKVSDLMIGTMDLPDQFFPVDAALTREVVDERVDAVRSLYAEEGGGHRASIHARLSGFYDDFEASAKSVLFDVIGV
ncbi:unnamed protein product [Scytosiphon promiscuus]